MIILGLSERGRDSEDVQPTSELFWKKAKATNRAIDKDLDVFTYDPFKVVFDSTIYIRSRKKLGSRVFRPPEPGHGDHVNIQAAPAEQLNSILLIDIRIAGHYTLP